MAPALLVPEYRSETNGHTNGDGATTKTSDAQTQYWDAVSRFSSPLDPDQSHWWRVTGRQIARMMYEADYSVGRQIELLLFHRTYVIPCLGRQPSCPKPGFKSRVAPGADDGAPIGYSWRFGLGSSKPYIRHYIEPLGPLTGTAADPLKVVATKDLLYRLSKLCPQVDLTIFWKFAPYFTPMLDNASTRQRYASSAHLIGFKVKPDSRSVDVKTYMISKVPEQISEYLSTTVPAAMRDAYGSDVSLTALDVVRSFMESDPDGRQLALSGTTAIDCCEPSESRFKLYVVTRNTSFDHIAAIMSLGGKKQVSESCLRQLQELWYAVKGLPGDFSTSEELPVTIDQNGTGSPNGLSFYFDIHSRHVLPHVKTYFEVTRHAESDMEAAKAVTGFLDRHGRRDSGQAYLNVLQGMVPRTELESRRATQAFYSVALKGGELDITAYFLPECYRRFSEIWTGLREQECSRQRRSRFE